MRPRASIILAAGKGTRMVSDLPKVLHEIAGRPLLHYVLRSAGRVTPGRLYVVVGYGADQVIASCAGAVGEGVHFIHQREQLGTGHAVQQCEAALGDFDGTVIVLNGDVPCVRPETIVELVEHHEGRAASATVLTAAFDDPTGYGRIVRGPEGDLHEIVEERDATEDERRIDEINTGLFCFEKVRLFEALKDTGRENAQNEYYLTDVIAVLREGGERVGAFRVDDPGEVMGINTVDELERARQIIESW